MFWVQLWKYSQFFWDNERKIAMLLDAKLQPMLWFWLNCDMNSFGRLRLRNSFLSTCRWFQWRKFIIFEVAQVIHRNWFTNIPIPSRHTIPFVILLLIMYMLKEFGMDLIYFEERNWLIISNKHYVLFFFLPKKSMEGNWKEILFWMGKSFKNKIEQTRNIKGHCDVGAYV